MSKPTSPRHFEVFKKEVLLWLDKWGLNQWEVAFSHEPFNDDRAGIGYNLCGRTATFFLSTEWSGVVIPPSNATIKGSAKHEAIELLLAESYAIGKARYSTEDEHLAAHHALVRRLEKLL